MDSYKTKAYYNSSRKLQRYEGSEITWGELSRLKKLRKINDPNAWALLIDGDLRKRYSDETLCKDIHENKAIEDENGVKCHKKNISIEEALRKIGNSYKFDTKTVLALYEMQGDIAHLFKQLFYSWARIQRRNPWNNQEKSDCKIMNYSTPVKPRPNPDKEIRVPYITDELNGISFPWCVMKNPKSTSTQILPIEGYGDGLFVLNEDDKVIDCIRINDLWLLDLPLEQRLKHLYRCRKESEEYIVCWSLTETIEAGKILGANKFDGLLLRSLGEDYYQNYWLRWSVKSKTYAKLLKTPKKNRPIGIGKNRRATLISLDGEEDTGIKGTVYMPRSEFDLWCKIFELE